MSLILTEGFEGCDLASVHEKLTGYPGTTPLNWMTARDPSFDAASYGHLYNTQFGTTDEVAMLREEGRCGGDCLHLFFDLWNTKGITLVPGVYFNDEIYMGFAYKFKDPDTEYVPEKLYVNFYHTNNAGVNWWTTLSIAFVRTDTGWNVTPTTNPGGGYPVMDTKALVDRPTDGWRYIQIGIKWSTAISDPADGTIEVRSIGDSVSWTAEYSAPSYDNGMSGMSVYRADILACTTVSQHNDCSWLLDDIYMCTNAGSGPANTFLGAVRIQTLYPDADIPSYNDWTPGEGGAHYTKVDDPYVAFDSGAYNTAGDDGDEDYVETNLDDANELFLFEDIDVSGVGYSATILGVCLNVLARPVADDGVETHLRAISYKSGESVQDHDDLGAVVDDEDRRIQYGWYRQYLDQDPITAAAFTESGLNDTRFGVRNEEQLA